MCDDSLSVLATPPSPVLGGLTPVDAPAPDTAEAVGTAVAGAAVGGVVVGVVNAIGVGVPRMGVGVVKTGPTTVRPAARYAAAPRRGSAVCRQRP